MPKGDSSKKSKKSSSSTSDDGTSSNTGRSSKKAKIEGSNGRRGSNSNSGNTSGANSSVSTAASLKNLTRKSEITMTIPRKKEKGGDFSNQNNDPKATTSSGSPPSGDTENSKTDLPKLPKKTDSKGDSLATILPKKKGDCSNSIQQHNTKRLDPSLKGTTNKFATTSSSSGSGEKSNHPSIDDKVMPSVATISNRKTDRANKLETKASASKDRKNQKSTQGDRTANDTSTTVNTEEISENDALNGAPTPTSSSPVSAAVINAPKTKSSRRNSKSGVSNSKWANAGKKSNNNAVDGASIPNPELLTKKKKGRPPKIDLTLVQEGVARANNATNAGTIATVATPAKSPGPGMTAQDQHPFARSSVIEVWHGVEDPSEESWWSEDSDAENDRSLNGTSFTGTAEPTAAIVSSESNHTTTLKTKEGNQPSIRLCDIIDRVPTDVGKWRYYVHYRDFNRRMDEWISMERIVSPPSVGNAKARAIKKEEERLKRKQAREEEKKAEKIIDVSAPRASRRRSSVMQPIPGAGGGSGNSDVAGTTPTSVGAGVETPRQKRQRLQRRKSFDDDATIVAGNSEGGNTSSAEGTSGAVMAAEKGIVALPTQAIHTTAVGEHIVETIAAQELDEHEGLDEASLREHEEVTKVKNVAFVELGAFQMETWYFSPLPKELLSERGLIEVLYVCEFTFSLFARKTELQRFQSRLPAHARHPPGNEIYRRGNLAMFEVDGFEERIYCQNLCYIAKLFLDHKTLYFDVDPFLFYVLCEVDERGFHPVGYYSKEKYSDVGYNLACILTFPCHQRKGYGRFLIAFSYELSKKEEKVGSPEKPMSDLGQQAYKPYWASTIVDFLLIQAPEASSMSIMDISKITSIMAEDIVFTLNQLGILKIINGVYFVAAEEGLLQTLAKKYPVKEPRVDPSKLHWSPYITDVKRDKFSIHSKKPSVEGDENRGSGGFP